MRRKIKRILRLDVDQLEKIIRLGQRMSNVMYNMKQSDEVPKFWREVAAQLQSEWDKLKKD